MRGMADDRSEDDMTTRPLSLGDADFDFVVIGGGSAGFAAAIRAVERGASVVMVNEGSIGGT